MKNNFSWICLNQIGLSRCWKKTKVAKSLFCKINQHLQIRAVVVAQLVEQSLSTPEIYGLHPNISKLLSTNCIKEKTKIKKRHREWPIFKKILQIRSSYERTKKCSPPKALRRIHRWKADQQKNTKTRNLVFRGNRFVWMKRRQRHSETNLQSVAFERVINHHQIRDNVRCCCERDSNQKATNTTSRQLFSDNSVWRDESTEWHFK